MGKQIDPNKLVVLQYSTDKCDVLVKKLCLKRLPRDILSVDTKTGVWHARISKHAVNQKPILTIGLDARSDEDELVYLIIGVYDSSNPTHLTNMIRHGIDAEQHTLLCVAGAD
jgi:hypothetical protein